MAGRVEDYILDHGISVLNTECNRITLCAAEPTTYATAATTTNSLGYKTFPSFGAFGAPQSSANPVGEKVVMAPISDGIVERAGTATYWAATDTTNTRLHARGTLTAPTALQTGSPWSLDSFAVIMPSGVTAAVSTTGGWNVPGTMIAGA